MDLSGSVRSEREPRLVGVDCSCSRSSELTPSLGTSLCHRCSPKRKNKVNYSECPTEGFHGQHRPPATWTLNHVVISCCTFRSFCIGRRSENVRPVCLRSGSSGAPLCDGSASVRPDGQICACETFSQTEQESRHPSKQQKEKELPCTSHLCEGNCSVWWSELVSRLCSRTTPARRLSECGTSGGVPCVMGRLTSWPPCSC